MKNISLFTKWLGLLLTLLATLLLLAERAAAQQSTHEVKGKVSFKIEHKNMTLQDAQKAKDDKTAIPLKVSLIFEEGWVSAFDAGLTAYINASAFAFGITQREGATAPLETTNPPAWIYAASALNCSASDGGSLAAPLSSSSFYIRNPNWERQNATCPTFAYGALFSLGDPFDEKIRDTIIGGQKCYVLDLFNMYFRLKDLQTVYVRGIDCNDASDGVPSTDDPNALGGATVGTTILNIINTDGDVCYWPGAPKPDGKDKVETADWTLAPADYYGGIIPGGIFIEQVPDVTQFERSFEA